MASLRTRSWPPGLSVEGPVAKRALVLPGRAYPVDAPLLWWTVTALVEAGWHVHAVSWQDPPADEKFVATALDFVAAAAPQADTTVVVAKSLGTLAAPAAAERSLPAVWMTPVLTNENVANALRDYPVAQLAVGGTADPLWPATAQVSGDVMLVDGADHAMHRGSPRQSSSLHHDVADRVTAFAAGLI